MQITRRKFLKLGLLGGAGFALPLGTGWTSRSRLRSRISAAEAVASPKVMTFRIPLPIATCKKHEPFARRELQLFVFS